MNIQRLKEIIGASFIVLCLVAIIGVPFPYVGYLFERSVSRCNAPFTNCSSCIAEGLTYAERYKVCIEPAAILILFILTVVAITTGTSLFVFVLVPMLYTEWCNARQSVVNDEIDEKHLLLPSPMPNPSFLWLFSVANPNRLFQPGTASLLLSKLIGPVLTLLMMLGIVFGAFMYRFYDCDRLPNGTIYISCDKSCKSDEQTHLFSLCPFIGMGQEALFILIVAFLVSGIAYGIHACKR